MLLTRKDEFVAAARQAHLVGAAVVELESVHSDDAAEYLLRHQVAPAPPGWQAIAEELAAGRASPLVAALASPLTIALMDHALIASYTRRTGDAEPRCSFDTAFTTLHPHRQAAQSRQHA